MQDEEGTGPDVPQPPRSGPRPQTPKHADLAQDPAFRKHAEEVLHRFDRLCPRGQAPVLTILRVHLLTEYYMERLLAMSLPRGDKITGEVNLSYAQKLAVLDSLDILDDTEIHCLRALNRVRNSCAHEMDRDITLSDVERIGRPLGSTFTALRREFASDIEQLLMKTLQNIARSLTYHIWRLESDIAQKHAKK